ncbi:hypothetical protein CEXT_664031 [Caerostris extrusa]|uniref:Uncharacterized protein n=1 Tax=Caerostris extrusa TaxID=172846 RepID=A0AAV4SMZ2_CAEEX|nr:hypothetical protein CEXT_664031 [Caerostris extrusa]
MQKTSAEQVHSERGHEADKEQMCHEKSQIEEDSNRENAEKVCSERTQKADTEEVCSEKETESRKQKQRMCVVKGDRKLIKSKCADCERQIHRQCEAKRDRLQKRKCGLLKVVTEEMSIEERQPPEGNHKEASSEQRKNAEGRHRGSVQ